MDARKLTVTRARALRKTMTAPEVRLWMVLRDSGHGGLKFRRQHPLGPYILDFYCASARLAVEIDSEGHGFADQLLHDERRDAWVARRGILTLRVAAGEVMGNLDGVAQAILIAAARG